MIPFKSPQKGKPGQSSFKSLWTVAHSINKRRVNLLWVMKPRAATSTVWHTEGTYGPIERYARLHWSHAAPFIMLVNSNSKAALNSLSQCLFFLKTINFTTSSRNVKMMQQTLLNMFFSRITVKGCLSVIIAVLMWILVSANTDLPY